MQRKERILALRQEKARGYILGPQPSLDDDFDTVDDAKLLAEDLIEWLTRNTPKTPRP